MSVLVSMMSQRPNFSHDNDEVDDHDDDDVDADDHYDDDDDRLLEKSPRGFGPCHPFPSNSFPIFARPSLVTACVP